VSEWVSACIAFVALLLSIGGVVFVSGRHAAELKQARDDIKSLHSQVELLRKDADEDSKALRNELRELLGALKEFSREQAAVNIGVTKTLDACTRRLEDVGDLVMQHKAVIELHGEILRRKGLVSG